MKRRLGTIGAHLVTLVVIQIVVVLGLIGYAAKQDFSRARSTATANMTAVAASGARFISQDISDMRQQMTTIGSLLDSISLQGLCEAQKQNDATPPDNTYVQGDVFFMHADGSAACAYKAGQPNLAGEPWFKSALATPDTTVERIVTDPIHKERVLLWATYVSKHHIVIAFDSRYSTAPAVLKKQLPGPFAGTSFVITTKDQTALFGTSAGDLGTSLAGTGFGTKFRPGLNEFKDLTGTPRFWSVATVEDMGWKVFAGVSKSAAYASARHELTQRVALALIFMIIVLAAAAVIQRRFVRPIRSLAKVTRRATEGDLAAKVTPSGPVELSELGASLNEMLDVRQRSEIALKKAVKAEQKAADELREVDGMRQAFLLAISHELRTPLTSVVGYASFLQDARADLSEEELTQSIDAIASQSQRLERLLLDLLDVERLTRGTLEPNITETDVKSLVTGAIDRTQAKDRITPVLAKEIRADVDPALVERIVENLVNNAVKHTPADAKIWVRASRRNGDLRLVVEDDGPGVPDEMKTAIFEPFKQGEVQQHAPGTGVGLSLVSQFAKLHGGRAWVEDRKGGGAAFHVVVPAKARGKLRAAA